MLEGKTVPTVFSLLTSAGFGDLAQLGALDVIIFSLMCGGFHCPRFHPLESLNTLKADKQASFLCQQNLKSEILLKVFSMMSISVLGYIYMILRNTFRCPCSAFLKSIKHYFRHKPVGNSQQY